MQHYENFFLNHFDNVKKNLGWDKNDLKTKSNSQSFFEIINVKWMFYYKYDFHH